MTGTLSNKHVEKLSRTRQRQKLIDACISALYLHGPSRTTIDKVVSIADMSPGIVNFYFETKAALLLSALESLAVEFEERVLTPVTEARTRPVEALELLIALYLDADIASPRKISVWYSFWGEASSRREYHAICGKRDVAFAELVRDLVERLIAQSASAHLDADAVALGLIGALEIMWQDIAFQSEADVDRESAKRRCRAYLRSVFPRQFGGGVAVLQMPPAGSVYADEPLFDVERRALFHERWQWVAHGADLASGGDYVAAVLAGVPVLAVRDSQARVRVFRNTCARRPHAVVPGPDGHVGGVIVCAGDGLCYALDGTPLLGSQAGLEVLPSAWAGELLFTTCGPGAGGLGSMPHGQPSRRDRGAAAYPAMVLGGLVDGLGGLVPLGPWHLRACLADWKLIVDHWTDIYCSTGSDWRMAGPGAGAPECSTVAGGLVWRMALDGLGRACVRQIVWPNLFVELRPDGATIRQVLPVAPGRCEVRSRQYGLREAGREARARAMLAGRLNRAWDRQDDAVVESTQQALLAPYATSGPEQSAFRDWLRDALPPGNAK